MSTEELGVYRERIYSSYVKGRNKPLAPDSLEELNSYLLLYLRRMVERHFPPQRDAAILDLGCGHGTLIHVLGQMGYSNVRGIDGSPEQVAAARNLGIPNVEHGDVMASLQSIPDASQEVVVAFDLIEHFTKSELITLVDEVKRVLRPGGRWILHTPNGESPFGPRMRYWDFTHELAFTRTSLAQLLKASGFDRVESFEDTPIPHGRFRRLMRFAIWKAIRAVLLVYLAAETGNLDRQTILTQNLLAVAYIA